MLDFKKNRLTYSDLLSPPEGYELTKAIGTSYSLDLYALLAIPVAMFYAKSLEGNFTQNRYDVLDAIRMSNEKVTLFCQRGKIHAPDSYSSLLAFVEECIVEVLPPHFAASFHPKIWVLRFEKKKNVVYRLAVLSRNLTFDRSWDISYFTEGKPQENETKNGKKLASYLTYLHDYAGKQKDIKFLRELTKVDFELPVNFLSTDLYPIVGFNNESANYPNPLTLAHYDELLIISPFLDAKTINLLKANNKKIVLFSRKDELDKIEEDVLKNDEVYYFNKDIRDGEFKIDSEDKLCFYQDLHAKIFIGKRGRLTDWFIGSANCSQPALDRNVEFLIKNSSKSSKVDFQSIKEQLTNKESQVFFPYQYVMQELDIEKENLEKELRKLNHEISKTHFKGVVSERENQLTFDLSIVVDLSKIQSNPKLKIKISLLHRTESGDELTLSEINTVLFQNIALTQLSKFVIVEILIEDKCENKLVVKVHFEDFPNERDNVIFNQLINSKHSFYQYLQFLLSPDEFEGLINMDQNEIHGNANSNLNNKNGLDFPIYEYLMKAASRSPRKLKEINQIMNRMEKLNSEILADFKPIWEVFKEFAND
ncbi:phospholipase D family protein [Pedobacter sp. Leaf250]|uniref:phospholipase D family protein n=1 Tax=Pedobacter sp. Leaf250 TaxID=2876559 RepID=UPI001E540F4F|nr:phospholipase D family protein [Pedobacter sp. Leaf250]